MAGQHRHDDIAALVQEPTSVSIFQQIQNQESIFFILIAYLNDMQIYPQICKNVYCLLYTDDRFRSLSINALSQNLYWPVIRVTIIEGLSSLRIIEASFPMKKLIVEVSSTSSSNRRLYVERCLADSLQQPSVIRASIRRPAVATVPQPAVVSRPSSWKT